MGFFGGLISAVGGFIGGITSKVGMGVVKMAQSVIGVFNKIKIPGTDLVGLLGKIANTIGSVLDVLNIKSEEDPEVLGAKAEQCEKGADEFNSTKEYIKHLTEEMELDREKFDKLTPEEKTGCKAVGVALETKAIEEEIGDISISPECLGMVTKLQMNGVNINGKDLVKIINALKEEGITNLNDVVDYLEGNGDSNRLATGEALVTALGEDGEEKVNTLKDTIRKYEEE